MGLPLSADLFCCDGCGVISDNPEVLADGSVVCEACASEKKQARCGHIEAAARIGSDGRCEVCTTDGAPELSAAAEVRA